MLVSVACYIYVIFIYVVVWCSNLEVAVEVLGVVYCTVG